MADYRVLVPKIKSWEGGYVNDPDDSGGTTNKGVTLATFCTWYGKDKTAADLAHITDEQWLYIFLNGFWNKMRGDSIKSQSIANIIVDWGWASGPATAAKEIQKIVGTDVDGIIGPKTLTAINTAKQKTLFEKIKTARLEFVDNLVKKRPKDKKYIKGWKARINSFEFTDGTSGTNTGVVFLALAAVLAVGVAILKK